MKLTKPLLMLLLLSQACKETEILEVPGKGTLEGYVMGGYYSFSNRLEGVKVTIEGTDPLITIATDDEGAFKVNDLPTGTYHLLFQKPGFGTYKLLGYTFIGGSQPFLVAAVLYPLPQTKIKDISIKIGKQFNYTYLSSVVSVDLPEEFESLYFRYYLSNSSDVSPSNYLITDAVAGYQSPQSTFSFAIDTEMFPPGSDLYMVVYPCTETMSSYLDLDTGNEIYTSISLQGSNVVTATIPL
jgi:hypothetical protein